jgi:hypothetical protein
MQVKSLIRKVSVLLCFCSLAFLGNSQVNAVEYGKNRIQHKKFKWKFYQSANFNTYFTQNGLELGKYAAQLAESELAQIESAIEYSLQRRVNIVVYNNFEDMKSSNIGLGNDWAQAGGITKLVNNKMVVYFNGDHAHLKKQIREGIARVLLDNQLFGDDIGEFASNQALLDLPVWLTDGYVSYIAEPWSTAKDDDLKSAMLSGSYNNFYQFAFEKPLLAGHSFWYYIAEKYKKENVTYFLYLARIYKNLNSASQRICKKKFKDVLGDFMQFQQEKYNKDIRQRRNIPKGTLSVMEEIGKSDFYRFQANPNPRSNTYAVVEFKRGIYRVKLNENYVTTKVLLETGVRMKQDEVNPNYPLLAWDGKGTRLAVVYWEKGKIKLFVYDALARYKRFRQTIEGVDQILDVQFMLDANTLLFSAVKNGHTDIFSFKVEQGKLEQLTDDVYDDLNPSFVSFPNKSGIIFSSNRPGPNAPNTDTVLPSNYRYNVFLLDYLTKKQITQLTDLKYGNATYPMQYNVNHFTFIADENGIGNRWAGFFTTQRDGLDTLFYIGDELLRNPSDRELDSALVAWQKNEPDSISTFSVTRDSTYTFPMSNYQSSLLETRIAGDKGQVSEVSRQGDYKFLYKLRVDSLTLRKRNVNARPTEYMKKLMTEKRIAEGKANVYQKTDSAKNAGNVFQTEFQDEKPDSAATVAAPATVVEPILSQAKLYNYKLKFSSDYLVSGVSNNILINRFQPYAGGTGPVQLGNGSNLNFTFRVGVSDLMEDVKFIGGFRMGTNLRDNDYLLSFQNYRKKIDWGFTYYRTSNRNFVAEIVGPGVGGFYNTQLLTQLYQGNATFAFNEVKSLRVNMGLRKDKNIIKSFNNSTGQPDVIGLEFEDVNSYFGLAHIEYVHDNTINPTQNIWDGLRWKVYMDFNLPVKDPVNKGKFMYNFGFDARYYKPIYRNFIWAVRGAGDVSWGSQKMIYYLGGVDGWLNPKFNNANKPAPDNSYAFQTLAVNMRGFQQNVANGNNALVINSELRLPIFSTLFNKPINNAFLRNLQLVQFIDLGTAWNGKFDKIERPSTIYTTGDANNPVTAKFKAGGIGPFVGGYGFGVRSTLLGYFLKFDTAWEMNGIFKGKPITYFAMGFDF